MEKRRKEILTKESIIKDLLKAEKKWALAKPYNSFSYIMLIVLLSIIIGIVLNIYLGIVVCLFAIYPLIQFIREIRLLKIRKQVIKNGEVTITIEKLINVGEEAGYESKMLSQQSRRVDYFLYFSYQKWSIPAINYTWSNLYKMSRAGVMNTSVIGNEFYVVLNNYNHEIGCAYNTKFFETSKEYKGV